MVAAVLLILVLADTFATGYLVALFGRVRSSLRELDASVSALSDAVSDLETIVDGE